MKRAMNSRGFFVVSLVYAAAMLVVPVRPAHGQTHTPGQITKFDPALNVVDSVITEDASGKIGIGTTAPAAALDVATGDLNVAGNILKGGVRFIHNFGTNNTFLGQSAGNLTMTGTRNTGSGVNALLSNTAGDFNTAVGAFVLANNTSGSQNTASGDIALLNNGMGFGNTASGAAALSNNTAGSFNTANGRSALLNNTIGNGNTAVGFNADVSVGNLTNATAIGAGAVVDASNKVRLGDALVTVIEGQVPYTFSSDKKQKENFQSVDGEEVLRKIGALSVTSWNYKGHDPQQFRHYGPVAQEFFTAFGHDRVGTIGTPTTINSGDFQGILMIAVQALEKRTAENADLLVRIEALERLVKGRTAAGK